MELKKRYTTFEITGWHGECPHCASKNHTVLFRGEGSWYIEYRCSDCNTHFAYNQGDAMGGQSDYMEIYEPN